jgi:hypothetical protein
MGFPPKPTIYKGVIISIKRGQFWFPEPICRVGNLILVGGGWLNISGLFWKRVPADTLDVQPSPSGEDILCKTGGRKNIGKSWIINLVSGDKDRIDGVSGEKKKDAENNNTSSSFSSTHLVRTYRQVETATEVPKRLKDSSWSSDSKRLLLCFDRDREIIIAKKEKRTWSYNTLKTLKEDFEITNSVPVFVRWIPFLQNAFFVIAECDKRGILLTHVQEEGSAAPWCTEWDMRTSSIEKVQWFWEGKRLRLKLVSRNNVQQIFLTYNESDAEGSELWSVRL